jgi:Zn-dependent peptidase ImmA (M78 family)
VGGEMVRRRWKSFLVKEFLKKERCNDPEEAIIRLAQRLVKNAGIVKPPVDVFALAKFYKVKVREVRDMEIDGQVIPFKNNFIIEISKEKPIKRKRFTVAHELIHVFLMKNIATSFNDILKRANIFTFPFPTIITRGIPLLVDREVEYLCNLGAGEILMPSYLFEPKLKSYGISIDTLFRLSKEFQTSITSTAMRIVRANENCVFIFWKFMEKPGAIKDLRVSWSITPKNKNIFIPRYDRAISENLHLSTVYEAFKLKRRSSRVENINWLGNLKGYYYIESVRIKDYNDGTPGVLSLIHLTKK